MNIIQVFENFKTQEQSIQYLEQARWKGHPICPYCDSDKVCAHSSGDRSNQRWQCQKCSRAFSVTVGTMFHRTHIPLRSWFLMIALMLNAKKSASAFQIARDLGMRRPTVWSMMHRIRKAMSSDSNQEDLLYGIVEADETYIGGKPRKKKNHKDDNNHKRGRGTSKTPVLGVVERGGRVYAEPVSKKSLNGKGLAKFIQRHVDTTASLLMTDEYRGYNKIKKTMRYGTVNHSYEYANGMIHTNTIEGFWALVKRAFYGQHHHYSKKYTPLYIAEACYKYNNRQKTDSFSSMIGLMVAA